MIHIGTKTVITNFINLFKETARGNIATKDRFPYLDSWSYDRKLTSPGNYTSLLNAYKSWVYVCASRNSSKFADYHLKLYVAKSSSAKTLYATRPVTRKTKDFLYSPSMGHLKKYLTKEVQVEEVLEHPFIELMKKVNPFMDNYELKEKTDLHLELTGNAYWYIIKSSLGLPSEIWIIPPDHMNIIPSKEEFIKGYLYKEGTNEVAFEPNEIIHFKFPNPTSMYYGTSPLSAVTYAYDINVNMNKYEEAVFRNMGRLDSVLETDDTLDDKEFSRIQKQWNSKYKGVEKAGQTALLEKGLKYKQISLSPRDLSFLMGRKVTKEEIMNAYGVPLGLFSEESNRANSEMANYNYMTGTISPRHRRTEAKINELLLPMYDERLFCVFENCVPENEEFEHRKRTESVNKYITINEARQEIGQEEVDGGDNLYVDNRLIPISYDGEEINELSKRISEKVREKLNAKT